MLSNTGLLNLLAATLGVTCGPVGRCKRGGAQADTLIVHQLAVLVSQALLFLALGQGSVTISARVR
jgi:hypothetical protein